MTDERPHLTVDAAEIRDKTFTQRLRGVDHDEVDDFLNRVAYQVAALEQRVEELVSDNAELYARSIEVAPVADQASDQTRDQVSAQTAVLEQRVEELARENAALRARLVEAPSAPAQVTDHMTDQAATLFQHAQQVADALIEEAVQRAGKMLTTARSQQRNIIAEARGSVAVRTPADASVATPVSESDDVRHFVRITQAQLQVAVDEFIDQVERLGEVAGDHGDSAVPAHFSVRPRRETTWVRSGGRSID